MCARRSGGKSAARGGKQFSCRRLLRHRTITLCRRGDVAAPARAGVFARILMPVVYWWRINLRVERRVSVASVFIRSWNTESLTLLPSRESWNMQLRIRIRHSCFIRSGRLVEKSIKKRYRKFSSPSSLERPSRGDESDGFLFSFRSAVYWSWKNEKKKKYREINARAFRPEIASRVKFQQAPWCFSI